MFHLQFKGQLGIRSPFHILNALLLSALLNLAKSAPLLLYAPF